jgi:DNA processing protein
VSSYWKQLGVALDNRTAYVVLNLLPGIGPLRVNHLLSLFGTPQAVLAAKRAELARVPGIGDRLAGVLHHWEQNCSLENELALVKKAGVVLVTREDDDYPALLREIHDPPLCLYVRGNASLLGKLGVAIAIVGSRRTTHYGIRVAENLATAAALAGWPVVSGLARGIDTVAHQATLSANGKTIAVLGSGLAHVYPQQNIDLGRRIAESAGALLSEFPMLYRPDKRTFPMRNRVISGMTQGTVVVEAGLRSGSLITAGQALEQNRQVFAVPGKVDSPQSRGCHALLKDGARLVENFDDILDEFSQLPGLSRGSITPERAGVGTPATTENPGADLQLSDTERKLLSFLGANEASIDALISALGLPTPAVLGAIVTLEMRHIIRQLPGRRIVLNNRALAG